MDRFLFILIILSWSTRAIGQEQTNSNSTYDFYTTILEKVESMNDLVQINQYLDSIGEINEALQWQANLARVELYRFIEDSSTTVANKLIDQCLVYYRANPDTLFLLDAYELKVFISEDMRDIEASIFCLNEAILFAESINDSTYISFFEKYLGFFYLDNLSDTTRAFEHLKRAWDIAVQFKEWNEASLAASKLITYYLFVSNLDKAHEFADLSIHYSSYFDTTDYLHYAGYLDRADFFLKTKEYSKAIKDATLVFEKGNNLKYDHFTLLGANFLTELYWKINDPDRAYYFLEVALSLMQNKGVDHEIKNLYYWGAKIYANKGNHLKSFELLAKFYAYEKQNQENLKVKAIAKALYQGELTRKELENEKIALNLSLAEERSYFKSLIIAGILLLCIIILIYSLLLYQKKQKAIQLNKILEASKEVVLQQKELLLQNIAVLKKDLDAVQQDQANDTFYFSQSAIQLNFSDIIYLESSNNYVLIHIKTRTSPLLERIKMIELIKTFPSTTFIKTHRSYYVNKNHIIARPSKYRFKMSNGVYLNASRSCVGNLNGILT